MKAVIILTSTNKCVNAKTNFNSKKEAKLFLKKWFAKFPFKNAKLINKNEQLLVFNDKQTDVYTIWTEKEYNKFKAIDKNF